MAKLPSFSEEERTELVAFLDGELDETAAAKVEARINLDAQVRSEAEALRKTWELLDFLPNPQPSASFTHRTLERLALDQPITALSRKGSRWRNLTAAVGWAAAVLVAAAAGYVGGRYIPHRAGPSPTETSLVDDQDLLKDFRVIEHKKLYEIVDNLQFLRSLADPDDPDLFGDENRGS
jgi:anti-sigma factor RsiW